MTTEAMNEPGIIMPHQERKNESAEANLGEIVIYQSEDGQTALDVRLKDKSVWPTQKHISSALDRLRTLVAASCS